LVGAKRTTRLVEPKPGRLKGVPERMLKCAGLVAVPLVIDAPPRFVSTKLACALEPTATVPKSKLDGATANSPGVKPLPVTALVLLPPLLVKATPLLKLPAVTGVKLTATLPV